LPAPERFLLFGTLARHRRGAWPGFRCGYVLIASLCVSCAMPPPPGAEDVSAAIATMADTDLQDYQLRALETLIQRMPDGPEREYFSGMLAARSGRFGDAVARLNRALPHLRESDPKRAAIALEAIATAYRADNQYGNAARAYLHPATPCHEGGTEHDHVERRIDPARPHECRHRRTVR
jgi:hypothetical protein